MRFRICRVVLDLLPISALDSMSIRILEARLDEPLTWRSGNDLIASRGSERWLADRIQDERKERGWSQVQLSKELAKIGSPLQQSAISKIESPPKGERRAISIGEAIGFARVFGIPLGELLLPPEAVWHARYYNELTRLGLLFEEARRAREVLQDAIWQVAAGLDDDEFLANVWKRDVVDAGLEDLSVLAPGEEPRDSDFTKFLRDEASLIMRYVKAMNASARGLNWLNSAPGGER